MKLYEIKDEHRAALSEAISEDGEILDEARFAEAMSLEEAREEKVASIVALIAENDRIAAVHKHEAERIAARGKAHEGRSEYLKSYLVANLPDNYKQKTIAGNLSMGESYSVQSVADVDALPDDFKRIVPPVDARVEPDKKALLAARKDGLVPPGVTFARKVTARVR